MYLDGSEHFGIVLKDKQVAALSKVTVIKQVVVHKNGMKISLAYPRVFLGTSQQNICPSSVKVITQHVCQST